MFDKLCRNRKPVITADDVNEFGEIMRGIKKFWLTVVFAACVGSGLSFNVEARPVTVSPGDGIKFGLGDMTGNPDQGFDQLVFGGQESTTSLRPDLVPNPNLGMQIRLGRMSYTVGENCDSTGCSAPQEYSLSFTIYSEGQQQVVNLGFTWSTNYIMTDNGPSRSDGNLVFSGFSPSPIIFNYAYDNLLVQLLTPQDISVEYIEGNPVLFPVNAFIILIPEPSTMSLFGFGGLAAWAMRRKRRKAALAVVA